MTFENGLRAIWLFSALTVSGVSIVLASVGGYRIGYSYTDHTDSLLAISWAGLLAGLELIKAFAAVTFCALRLDTRTAFFMAVIWLTIILLNGYSISGVLITYVSGPTISQFAFDHIVGLALCIEILSGCLPAIAYTAFAHRSTSALDADVRHMASDFKPPPTAKAVIERPKLGSIKGLILYSRQYGCSGLPGVTRGADGSLFAGQRAFANILGVSVATCNAWLRKESEAGEISVTPTSRGTRIALAPRKTTILAKATVA
jgi:hypothetical protein